MWFPQLLNPVQYLIENVFVSSTQDERHLMLHSYLFWLEELVCFPCEIDTSSRGCLSLALHLPATVLHVSLSRGDADSISEMFQCKAQVLQQLELGLKKGCSELDAELPRGTHHPE